MSIQKVHAKYMLFIPQLGVGGAERVIVEYANGLAAAGAEVHLACLKGGIYEKDLSTRVHIYHLGGRMRAVPLLLFRLVRSIRPDIILSGLTGPNLVTAIVGRLSRVPNVWISIHNDLRSKEALQSAALHRYERILIRIASALATQVFAVSKGVRSYLVDELKVPSGKVSVIYNPIYHYGIVKLAQEPISDPLASTLDNKRYVVAAGRLERQKGFDLLIKAYAKSGLASEGIDLVILGEGSERFKLEKLSEQFNIAGALHFPGFLPNPYAIFSKAEVFVLSSRWEGFGNVLVEALACGTPVISFDCPSGPREILEGVSGCMLVSPQNADELSQALVSHFSGLQLHSNDNRTLRRSRAEEFSRQHAVNKLLSYSVVMDSVDE